MNRILLILLFISPLVLAQNPEQVRLETINPATVKPNSGELKTNRSFDGNQLNINGTGYSNGLGVRYFRHPGASTGLKQHDTQKRRMYVYRLGNHEFYIHCCWNEGILNSSVLFRLG